MVLTICKPDLESGSMILKSSICDSRFMASEQCSECIAWLALEQIGAIVDRGPFIQHLKYEHGLVLEQELAM